MLSRNLLWPLVALIGGGLINGAIAAGAGFSGQTWTVWLIVGALAALVIATLVAQVRAAIAADEPEGETYFAAVNGQTMLVVAALVVAGTALILATFAPKPGLPGDAAAFSGWAGAVLWAMGFVLALVKATIGGRKPTTPPRTMADQFGEH